MVHQLGCKWVPIGIFGFVILVHSFSQTNYVACHSSSSYQVNAILVHLIKFWVDPMIQKRWNLHPYTAVSRLVETMLFISFIQTAAHTLLRTRSSVSRAAPGFRTELTWALFWGIVAFLTCSLSSGCVANFERRQFIYRLQLG